MRCMVYTDNDILFPHDAIPCLRGLCGPEWDKLVDEVLTLPETHERTLALMLTMIRLNGCMACETDSYRAMRGCANCAIQTLRRYKGGDAELLQKFDEALRDIRNFGDEQPQLRIKSS